MRRVTKDIVETNYTASLWTMTDMIQKFLSILRPVLMIRIVLDYNDLRHLGDSHIKIFTRLDVWGDNVVLIFLKILVCLRKHNFQLRDSGVLRFSILDSENTYRIDSWFRDQYPLSVRLPTPWQNTYCQRKEKRREGPSGLDFLLSTLIKKSRGVRYLHLNLWNTFLHRVSIWIISLNQKFIRYQIIFPKIV